MPTIRDSRVATGKERPECFVIMPIGDPDGYDTGHFQRVFEDIFTPACTNAGFQAVRADQVRETNLIHLDVLQRLLQSPIVLCDLSSRNPNVLFELGLRQAFDKPTVLVQEEGTPKIFDIAPLRLTEYRRARRYDEVLEDQRRIGAAIQATHKASNAGSGVNSMVRILALTQPAALPELQQASRDPALQIVLAELNELRSEVRQLLKPETSGEEASLNDAARLSIALGRYGATVEIASGLPERDASILHELSLLREKAGREMARYEERNGHIPETFRLQNFATRTRHDDLLQGITREVPTHLGPGAG